MKHKWKCTLQHGKEEEEEVEGRGNSYSMGSKAAAEG